MVYEYEIDLEGLDIKYIVDDNEFLDYVYRNRTEKEQGGQVDHDVVIGKTATGYCAKMFKAIRNKGEVVSREQLRDSLLKSTYGEQICLKTEKALTRLKLVAVHSYDKSDFEKIA